MPNRQHNSTDLLRLALAVLFLVIIMATGVLIGQQLSRRSSAPATPPIAQSPVVSPGPPSVPPTSPNSNEFDSLVADFAQLESQLQADLGVAVSAVGPGASPKTLGTWTVGPAWSTIKVPLAIAALRGQDSSQVSDAMKAAIVESDNAAAESIWQSLGDPVTAAHKVEAVLQEADDFTTVQSQRIRPEFTAFGQTQWPLTNQAQFLAFAKCDRRNGPIFELMGQVEQDQRWGLGTIPGTQIKGGWGPSLSGSYLIRQIGTLSTPKGIAAVAIAAQPSSGSFADGTRDLTAVAEWLNAHIGALPAGQCPH